MSHARMVRTHQDDSSRNCEPGIDRARDVPGIHITGVGHDAAEGRNRVTRWRQVGLHLGSKVIYYYSDMKVTFVDGQVSDVQ